MSRHKNELNSSDYIIIYITVPCRAMPCPHTVIMNEFMDVLKEIILVY